MMEVHLVQTVLMEVLSWNRARINFLANFIIALIKVKNVNLVEIATAFSGKAKQASKYKRIKRFFSAFSMEASRIAELVIQLLPIKREAWALVMDRTTWKLGKVAINILMLGIAYKGIAFPILWMLLPKLGNSNTEERIALMDHFLTLFGVEKIKFFCADREFLGQAWFSYLLKWSIHFRIRIRENMLVSNAKGGLVPAKALFRDLKVGEYKLLEGKRQVCGGELFVLGLLLPSGEYLILVTDKHPDTALEDYAQRWEIETLFGCLKSRGFRLEETHMTTPERLSKLVALLAITFCWAHLTGEWVHEQHPIKLKTHGRKASSIFRYGLDYLRALLLNIAEHSQEFREMVDLLRNSLTASPKTELDSKKGNQTRTKEDLLPQEKWPLPLAKAA